MWYDVHQTCLRLVATVVDDAASIGDKRADEELNSALADGTIPESLNEMTTNGKATRISLESSTVRLGTKDALMIFKPREL